MPDDDAVDDREGPSPLAFDGGPDAGSSGPDAVPSPADTSGYGLSLTLVGAVLLALAYYGVVAIQGPRELGQAIPEPFYGLVVAFLFVVELLQRGRLDAIALGRAIALAVVYGGLFVFAVEGAAYLWERPDVALTGYVGVTVFAAALVVAALLYVGYLTIVGTDRAGS
ncbi:hypothetical protein ACFO5R_13510 [Halosolutus amylolyticus]|uniref:Uncharacterized protein n=1 Tax=Halosolutus amylolyticus TaxID=2932267 RepID=A0ABD5PSN0_9EURY|nr:hypothetical protein [Halosolutus amylolyticus]